MEDLKRAASSEVFPEMSNRSNSTGTLRCSKISSTELVISFPTPSPGMRVTWMVMHDERRAA